ncbi:MULTISPECIES: hypothetical protein [Pseudomonas syringae group]|uniref:Lytic transglycosylase n=1 Tax=Pseudomonas syringae pv. viburni TaxID=251703 RepID=A0A0Q0DC19_9PSED|nr:MULTISPECIES: hypothetical protein [Pseudomonas syringae group]KPZ24956.1 hypothetical protein ALO40_200160 [Pseudomonas syringae pv. viburni]
MREDDPNQHPEQPSHQEGTHHPGLGQNMANGVGRYTDAAIDAYDASLALVSGIGGDPEKTRSVARYLAKQGMRDLIQENMAHLNASGQTSHLASFAPLQPLEDPNGDRSGAHPTINKLLDNLGKDDE